VQPASIYGLRQTNDAGGAPVGVQGAKPPVAEGKFDTVDFSPRATNIARNPNA
jgi:hypothetical protein